MLYPRFKSASQSHINTRGKGGSKYPPLSPPGKKTCKYLPVTVSGERETANMSASLSQRRGEILVPLE